MSIFTALSGAIAAEERVNTVANNLANVNTPGFKKDSLTFKEYLTEIEKVDEAGLLPRASYTWDDYNNLNGHDKSYVDISTHEIDFKQGSIEQTGNTLDFSINGEGFFPVRTPSGIAFTRNGSFTVNSEGLLVTAEGHPILTGEVDSPGNQNLETIAIMGSRIDIDNEGNIYQDGTKAGEITLVSFEDLRGLSKVGSSLFVNNDPVINPVRKMKSEIIQGAVEASNVNPIQEIVEMIAANRAFESYHNVIKNFKEINTRSANEIGRLVG